MATAKPPIGSRVGGYRLISLLGEGATGAVYLAEAETTGERVALKLLGSELGRDERFRRRLLRESEIAASLEHPNVVPVVDYGEADGVLYLAMRFWTAPTCARCWRRLDRSSPSGHSTCWNRWRRRSTTRIGRARAPRRQAREHPRGPQGPRLPG